MLKKTTAVILTISLLLSICISASAFQFPEPDWGALYYEKEDMVKENELELYVQGNIESAPYYGAKFEPRAGTYIGSVPMNAEKIMPLGSYLTNVDAMNQDDFYYPDNQMIRNDNVITMLGWTIYDLNTVDLNQVRKVLETVNSYNKPVLVRFANEMNCSNLGDDPDQYVEIFRKVADMTHEYPNLGVIWSPNDLGALDRPFEYYYPGDEYVDWIGVSEYMIKYFMGNPDTDYKNSIYFMTGDFAWATNKIKPIMKFLEDNNINKPVMLSECGVATSNRFGDEYESWTTPRLRNMLWYLVMKYPQIKMINYFDVYRADEVEKFDINGYPYAVDIFNEAKNSGAYLTEYDTLPKFVFNKANDAETLVARNGKVPLYTLAYITQQPDVTVEYYIDNQWYHRSSKIPYICNLDVNDLSDGKHTLTITALNERKTYEFYKKGNYVRFGAEPQQPPVSVTLNGEKIHFDQQPVLVEGRTLVPLRAIFEALGANVKWDDETETVTATSADTIVQLTIGSKELKVAGIYNNTDKIVTLDVAAQLINDRTMVPVRAIAESFSCNVEWDDPTQTVIITQGITY